MPKLTIDGVELEVAAGTSVLEAAKQAGVLVAVGAVGVVGVLVAVALSKGRARTCRRPTARDSTSRSARSTSR